jgi:hypothetical protein
MIPAKQLINEIVNSLRNVIAPAINEPYPKAQAYMAAVILEFVSRQVEERGDIQQQKHSALSELFHDLVDFDIDGPVGGGGQGEQRLSRMIEWLYQRLESLGEETFSAANQRIRSALRQMVDQELKIAKETDCGKSSSEDDTMEEASLFRDKVCAYLQSKLP